MDSFKISGHIDEFIKSEGKRILILGSMQTATRDKWTLEALGSEMDSHCFSLSNRVKNNIEQHRNIKSDSIYTSIYALNSRDSDRDTQSQQQSLSSHGVSNNTRDSEGVEQEEIIQHIIPVKSTCEGLGSNSHYPT